MTGESGLMTGGFKKLYLLHNIQTGSGTHPSSFPTETDHSSSSAEFRNGGAIP
jgi:hypothetical protein